MDNKPQEFPPKTEVDTGLQTYIVHKQIMHEFSQGTSQAAPQ